ncbi:uncharacterized protein SCHCODRAFT_02520808 [Schizophyllum commune H4-8]|nr:uncharacterized protein SCHCODRAFT_02520808 [Schizophyllum commune H4-8]KAI5885406.1 hypothetical protein SCHCODRAFT_02520808 [Schizophyllum commune H4-8]
MDPVYRWLASRSISGYFGLQVAKPALNNLPFDIFLIIVSYLLPQDIIALRKTCKDLQSLTNARPIWTAAVREMCKRNGVFLATYDLEGMSLDMLEHAATAPLRCLNLLRSRSGPRADFTGNSERRLSPLARQALALRLPGERPLSSYGEDHFNFFSLVPGGRFLLATSKRHFHIWDLGQNAYCGVRPLPLYVKTLDELLKEPEEPSSMGCNIMIYEAKEPGRIIFALYHAHVVGVFEVDFTARSMSDTYVVLSAIEGVDSTPVVWDYRLNKFARLDTQRSGEAFLSGTSVILPDRTRIRLTKLTEFHEITTAHGRRIRFTDLPKQCAPLPITMTPAEDDYTEAWLVQKPWYYKFPASSEFTLLGFRDLHHFDMAPVIWVDPSHVGVLPSQYPLYRARIPRTVEDENFSAAGPVVASCEGHMFVVFHDSIDEVSCMTYRATMDGTAALPAMAPLTLDLMPQVRDFDFCPASGRLCLLLHDQVHGPDELAVLDFLVPDRGLAECKLSPPLRTTAFSGADERDDSVQFDSDLPSKYSPKPNLVAS